MPQNTDRLYVRIEYDDNGTDPNSTLPWGIVIELNDRDFPEDDREFDEALQQYLVKHGYAPTLTNTKGIMPHLHGATYLGYYAETDTCRSEVDTPLKNDRER